MDNDPLVLAHARALLTSSPDGRTAYIPADLRDPAAILSHPVTREVLDFSRPVALMLVAILHFVVISPTGLRRFALSAGTRPRPGYQACPAAAMAPATSAGVVTQMPSMAVMARSASFT